MSESNSYILEPLVCRIESNELISRSDLLNRLSKVDSRQMKINTVQIFIMLTMKVVEEEKRMELQVDEVNYQFGNDSFSPHSPKSKQLSKEGNYGIYYRKGHANYGELTKL